MNIVIHAGLHKTGTTSFQNACSRARRALLGSGVLYPSGSLGIEDGGFLASHASLAHAVRAGRLAVAREYLDRCHVTARDRGCNMVLLSAEGFSSLVWKRGSLNDFNELLGKVFSRFEYVLVVRNIRDSFRSALKQLATHFACDLYGTKNLKMKLRAIPVALDRFVKQASPNLSLIDFEDLKKAGLCNELLRVCCSTANGNRLPQIDERHDNSTRDFQGDLFSLMTPLFRVCLAKNLGGVNPYSSAVNEQLQRLFDRDRMACILNEEADLADLSRVIEEGLDNIADDVLRRYSEEIAAEFSHLGYTGLLGRRHGASTEGNGRGESVNYRLPIFP